MKGYMYTSLQGEAKEKAYEEIQCSINEMVYGDDNVAEYRDAFGLPRYYEWDIEDFINYYHTQTIEKDIVELLEWLEEKEINITMDEANMNDIKYVARSERGEYNYGVYMLIDNFDEDEVLTNYPIKQKDYEVYNANSDLLVLNLLNKLKNDVQTRLYCVRDSLDIQYSEELYAHESGDKNYSQMIFDENGNFLDWD